MRFNGLREESSEVGSSKRLLPTGECWCGCGQETRIGSFFRAGHDRVAESAVIKVEYGGVPEFLDKHGYGDGGENPKKALQDLREKEERERQEKSL